MAIRRVTAKLGNMRKAEDFIVYPSSKTVDDKPLTMVQSSHRIAVFDPDTGDGLLSPYKANGAYFLHLNAIFKPMKISVPADLRAAFAAAKPNSGDEIGPGVRIA